MKKVVGRKGDISPMGMIITIIVLVVTAGIVILFVTGGFGMISDVFSKVSSAEVTAQACTAYANADLVNSYCNVFQKTEILGTKQWVTCEYLVGQTGITFDRLGEGCPTTPTQDALAIERCKTLRDKELVNGVVCWKDGKGVVGTAEWNVSKQHL